MQFKNYNFSKTKIKSIIKQGDYLWIAFKGESGETVLRKVSAFNLNQTFFEVTPSVDNIVDMTIFGNYLWCAVEDSSYIAKVYAVNNPFTTNYNISIPTGINENPKAIISDNIYVNILTPGEVSGENAKIIRYYGSNRNLVEKIDLSGINYARTFDKDNDDNFWIATYQYPSKLVKIYQGSGGIWNISSWNITV